MFFPFLFFPPAPVDYNLPPTLYSLMEAIVNYGEDEKEKIKDLAKYARTEIFDFTYPLSTNITKEDFECMILNHFIMRRIGYDTLTAFKIALNVKLNEIMPIYNKLFDALDNWNLFLDGEVVVREKTNSSSTDEDSTNSASTTTNSTNTNNSISDRRHSDLPQDRLSDVQDGSYVDVYDYDTDNNTSLLSATDSSSLTSNKDISTDSEESEQILRSPSDKIEIYKKFIENRTSIYTMIFKDLDVLFYGLAS